MYSVADYGAMIFDAVRMDRYVRALRHAIKPGTVVVDLGTGTGIFALLACRLGARRVYAIEPDDVIQVARDTAAANGCADRIEFIQARSTDVTLPEQADVIISDLGDALPWFQWHIRSIVDARRRLLVPGGTLIPQRDVAWAGVVDQRELYRRWMGPWDDNLFGLDMQAARRSVTNTFTPARVTTDNLLTELQRWATLDYMRVDDPDVRARVTWTATRDGTAHGLAIGFDRTVAEGICFSNAPDAADANRTTIYRTLFFPWPTPVSLDTGDVVTVDLEARLIRREYIWNWNTDVRARETCDRLKASFRQSTFFGVPLSPATRRTRMAG
jgi:SAM-dependent methyltransferase